MKKVGLILFSLFILTMSWENQRSVAALFTEKPIPEQSIRLRIIANSDSPEDQILKREIRDNINSYLANKVDNLKSIQEARTEITSDLPEIKEIVNQTIAKKGFSYSNQVELGVVPFPTKMYGQYVYPAGDYEALRVIVGDGLGQNWWCVLFPPLCFVDISTGDAVKKDTQTTAAKSDKEDKKENQTLPKIHVKFFLLEVFQNIWKAIFG